MLLTISKSCACTTIEPQWDRNHTQYVSLQDDDDDNDDKNEENGKTSSQRALVQLLKESSRLEGGTSMPSAPKHSQPQQRTVASSNQSRISTGSSTHLTREQQRWLVEKTMLSPPQLMASRHDQIRQSLEGLNDTETQEFFRQLSLDDPPLAAPRTRTTNHKKPNHSTTPPSSDRPRGRRYYRPQDDSAVPVSDESQSTESWDSLAEDTYTSGSSQLDDSTFDSLVTP